MPLESPQETHRPLASLLTYPSSISSGRPFIRILSYLSPSIRWPRLVGASSIASCNCNMQEDDAKVWGFVVDLYALYGYARRGMWNAGSKRISLSHKLSHKLFKAFQSFSKLFASGSHKRCSEKLSHKNVEPAFMRVSPSQRGIASHRPLAKSHLDRPTGAVLLKLQKPH